MSDALAEVRARLRDQGFEQLMTFADTAASLCRSIGEASYRGDDKTLGLHLLQLRIIVIAMLKTYNGDIDANRAIAVEPALHAHQDLGPGDGVARGGAERASGLRAPGAGVPAAVLPEVDRQGHDHAGEGRKRA